MTAHHVPLAHCPACNATLSAATNAAGDDAHPAAGDLTICLYCTAVMRFDDALVPALVDLAALPPDIRAEVEWGVNTVRQFQESRKRP